jgi:hypothetical protein
VNNIKMDLREIEWDDMDRINLAQFRDQWRALVITVMKLGIPRVAAQLAASQEGLSCVSE